MMCFDAPNGGLMATATSTQTIKALQPWIKALKIVVALVVFIAALWLFWNWNSIMGQARVGAAYGAHVTCSCRYIEGRDMASCATDKEKGMEFVRLSDDPQNKRVYASVPFMAEAVAERRGAFGCLQLNDAEIDAL
jgi:hypothetical protein